MFALISFYICIGLFLVNVIIQLIFAFKEDQKRRRVQKFLCMLTLGLALLFFDPSSPLIYIGAFLGMIGDILVLNKKTFVPGAVVFFLGHLCYMFFALFKVIGFVFIEPFEYIIILITLVVISVVTYSSIRSQTERNKKELIFQSIYFGTLFAYIPLFLISLVNSNSWMIMPLIGAIFFVISDSILVYTHFFKKFKRHDFYIMSTYLIAEVLITFGLLLTIV